MDPGFVANTDGRVEAVATSSDGRTVFLGGTFTSVNGQPRANLAAVDATTGAVLDNWSADTGATYHTVFSPAVFGDRLYVGGKFSGIDGTGRSKLAAVGATDGNVVAAFHPRAAGTVREVVVSPDGSATSFDPAVESGSGVVTVALSQDGSRFLATQDNFVRAYDPAVSNDPVWSVRTSGNTQAIAASGTEVYKGGHWSGFQDYGVKRPFLGSVSYSNGVPTSWDTQCQGDKMGVWALLIQGDRLHAAGVFRYFGSDPQRGYARFAGTPTP